MASCWPSAPVPCGAQAFCCWALARWGRRLGARLAALGANVTVCARRAEQRALAESLGLRGAELARLAALAPAFDTVVNTIPAPVLTEPVLTALRPGSLIVDLASKPGGTDFATAQRLGCKAIHALSLPAACAPDTAWGSGGAHRADHFAGAGGTHMRTQEKKDALHLRCAAASAHWKRRLRQRSS